MNDLRRSIEQNLTVGLLLLLLLGCLLVLWPFVTAWLWASVLSFSLWPVYRHALKLLGGRPTLAAFVVSLATMLAVLLPFGIVTFKLADNVKDLKIATERWIVNGLPGPPAWLGKVPVVGRTVTTKWSALVADKEKLRAQAESWVEPVGAWLLAAGLKLGRGMVQLALSLLITFFLLRNGPAVAGCLTRSIERIAGERGRHLLELAGKTVRGVVYGILGTALVQAILAGLGLLVSGVPGAALLAFLTFFLSVVPMGPPLVLFPAAFWLFHQGSTGWGVFMVVWAIIVSTADNFVKPWLISQGSDMPLILILFGVLGGALAFGFIGVFIGPTLLAVGYRLVTEWSSPTGAVGDGTTNQIEPALDKTAANI